MNKRTLSLCTALLLAFLTMLSFVGCSANNAAKDSDFYDVYDNGNAYYKAEAEGSGGIYLAPSASADAYYSKTNDSMEMAPETEVAWTESSSESAGGSSDAPVSEPRKIIRNASLTLETREFELAVRDIPAGVEQFGGYVESSYTSGNSYDVVGTRRNASFTLRVPAEQLDAYLNTLGSSFNIVSKEISSSDITGTYYDIDARLDSLLVQEERLLAMLEKSEELQYLLQLERELADVRYQIENYYSQLRRYDSQVAYSTVRLSVREVVEYQVVVEPPKTFGERFSAALSGSMDNFVAGLQNFSIEFVYALPTLLIWLVVILVIVLIIKLIVSSHKRKKAKKLQKWQQAQQVQAPAVNKTDKTEE